jgi:hypothetical protein
MPEPVPRTVGRDEDPPPFWLSPWPFLEPPPWPVVDDETE